MALIADGQPFTTIQAATELGLSNHRLRCLVEEGSLRRLVHGVYVDNAISDSVDLRARALSHVLSPRQVAADRTAAWLHGHDAYSLGEAAAGRAFEVCVMRGGTRTRLSDVDGRSRDLIPSDVMEVGTVRVTTPLRTALDLGCHLRRREAFAAMCMLSRKHALSVHEIAAEIPRFRGRRGVIQLRGLAPLVEPRVESPREAWTYLAILDDGLPAPEPQVWVDVDGVPTYRLDFAYRTQRTAVEYDGHESHHVTDQQRQRDAERRRWLREHGWTCIVVQEGDFSGARLDRWLLALRRALSDTYSTRRW